MTNKNGREIKIEDLFGEAVVDTQRDVKETAAFFDAVKKDLGICGPIGQALDEKRNDSVIKDFLVDVCMNIRYYTGQLNNAMKRRRMYMILNVLLIIAVPILVYLMSLVGLEISGSHSTQMHIAIIIAQLTAVLTGLLSLQRTFIEWQKHNSRFSQLWEAKANLKTEYYTLQTKWHGNVNEDSLECFLSDVRNS